MNDIQKLEEIKKIIVDHFIRGGQILESGAANRDIHAAKRAEDCFKVGLRKFNKIKLSRQNRRNIPLIRKAMEYAIKSAQALQKRQYDKAERYSKKSAEYALDYVAAVNKGVGD